MLEEELARTAPPFDPRIDKAELHGDFARPRRGTNWLVARKKRGVKSGSDGTRTPDLRRDGPVLTETIRPPDSYAHCAVVNPGMSERALEGLFHCRDVKSRITSPEA
jgi:hypothetical protein